MKVQWTIGSTLVSGALNCGRVEIRDLDSGVAVEKFFGPKGCCRGNDNTEQQAREEARKEFEELTKTQE